MMMVMMMIEGVGGVGWAGAGGVCHGGVVIADVWSVCASSVLPDTLSSLLSPSHN